MPDVKPAKSYADQLKILQDRGLGVTDETLALHCLEHHNYYRLSAYRFPLTIPGNADRFLPGADFDTLWKLYHFDQQLRQLVAEALGRFEISVRARWAYVLGHAHGSHAFEDPSVFSQSDQHRDCLEKHDDELRRSDEVFVSHYRRKHGMPRPPIWAAAEVMSFGLLSRYYANIRRFKDRKDIARPYRLFPETMKSLLEHAVYVRNLCAHHARLWNRRFTVTVALPVSQPAAILSSLYPPEDRRIYNTLVLLGHLAAVIEPGSDWIPRLRTLLTSQTYPVVDHMGFPSDWRNRPIWNPESAAVPSQSD